jgi:hypothetical protein
MKKIEINDMPILDKREEIRRIEKLHELLPRLIYLMFIMIPCIYGPLFIFSFEEEIAFTNKFFMVFIIFIIIFFVSLFKEKNNISNYLNEITNISFLNTTKENIFYKEKQNYDFNIIEKILREEFDIQIKNIQKETIQLTDSNIYYYIEDNELTFFTYDTVCKKDLYLELEEDIEKMYLYYSTGDTKHMHMKNSLLQYKREKTNDKQRIEVVDTNVNSNKKKSIIKVY